jgi:DNA-binding NtrC family response regulator
VRLFVIEALRDEGYAVEPAANAAEARALLERRRYDVLMTDIALPQGQDGFALAAWASRRRPGQRIVYSSGMGEPPRDRRWAHGSFLAKPFGIDGLLRSIEAEAEHARPAAA